MKKDLPKTLAQRVQNLRESSNLSKEKLSEIANVDIKTINDIEEGKEIFLSTTIRQKLSKALKVLPRELKEVEYQPQKNNIAPEIIDNIKHMILSGQTDSIICPQCGNTLRCKVLTFYDLEDIPVRHPKARCTKCPFQIK